MSEIIFTVHAQRTMAERKVTFDDIREIVTKPEVSYADPKYAGTEVRQRGQLAVVVRPYPETNTLLVITILWRRSEQWTNEEMSSR